MHSFTPHVCTESCARVRFAMSAGTAICRAAPEEVIAAIAAVGETLRGSDQIAGYSMGRETSFTR
jgi:hypothetical protein